MAKNLQQDFTKHFELARQKAKALGYANLLELDQHGTQADKLQVMAMYREPVSFEPLKGGVHNGY